MQYAEQQGEYTTYIPVIWRKNRTTGKPFQPGRKGRYVRCPHGLPSRFRSDKFAKYSRRAAAAKSVALNRRGRRLLQFHKYRVWLYSLTVTDLGGAAWLEDATRYEDLALIESWLRLLDAAFPGQPYRWALHIGRCGRVHAHVVAGQLHNIPNLGSNPEKRKRVGDTHRDRVRVLSYVTIKNEPHADQLANYRKAAKRAGGARHLPRHSGFRGIQAQQGVRKPLKKPVLDSVGRNKGINNSPADRHVPMTFAALETWLGSAFGDYQKTVLPPEVLSYENLISLSAGATHQARVNSTPRQQLSDPVTPVADAMAFLDGRRSGND